MSKNWLFDNKSSFGTLFHNIFVENKIIEELLPTEVKPLYKWKVPTQATIVFVPGIYIEHSM